MFKLVKEIKSKDGVLHFRRWAIFETRWLSLYLHKIYESDQDPAPHSHPWDFRTFILWGSYIEDRWTADNVIIKVDKKADGEEYVRFDVVYNRTEEQLRCGNTRSCRMDEYHRLTVLKGPVTSLVLVGKPVMRDKWSYLTPEGVVRHDVYRKQVHGTEN